MKTVKELRHEGLYEEALALGTSLYEKAKEENDNFKINISFVQLGYVYYDLLKSENTSSDQFIEYFKSFMSYQYNQNDFSTQLYDLIFKKVRSFLFELKNQDEQTTINRSSEILNILSSNIEFEWGNFIEIKNQFVESLYYNLKNTSHLINLSKWFYLEEFNLKNASIKILENGKKMMSLKEMFYTNLGKVVAQEYKKLSDSDQKHSVELLESLNHSLYVYIPYYLSKIYLIEKNKEKSRSFLLSILKTMSTTFWIWSDLAETYDDLDLKITCLCKSVSLPAPEKMKLNNRLSLAILLAQSNQYEEAKFELNLYLETANKMGYRTKNDALVLQNSIWFEDTPLIKNNQKLYKIYSQKIDYILYGDIKPIKVLVYYVNIEKNIVSFIDENNSNGFFYNKNNTKVSNGDILNVKFIKKEQSKPSQVLSFEITPSDYSNTNFYKKISNEIKVHELGFAFLDNVYISNDLIKSNNIKSGDKVEFIAIKSFDTKNQEVKLILLPDTLIVI
jgi:hypothetical protein